MNYLVVDDEAFALEDMEEALKKVQPDSTLFSCQTPKEALQYAARFPMDAAFLDIELGSMSGLLLSKKLKDLQPGIHIIFVTAHEQYALHAIKLRATGYLVKPVTLQDIRCELTFLYGESPSIRKICVQTFGGFDVSVNGKPLVFKRTKAKELLAFLIDQKGSSATNAQVCAALWEGDTEEGKKKNYLRVLVKELRRTLQSASVGDLLVKTFNSLAIRPELVDCDSYRFLDGDAKAVNQYRQNYLPGYSWAEFTLGELERRFRDIRPQK